MDTISEAFPADAFYGFVDFLSWSCGSSIVWVALFVGVPRERKIV